MPVLLSTDDVLGTACAGTAPVEKKRSHLLYPSIVSRQPGTVKLIMYFRLAGALLMCWAPPAPPAASEMRPAEHARAAAAAYRARLADILVAGPATSGVGVPSSELLLDSWKRFLSRWMGALKAAAHSDGSAGQVYQ